MKYQIISERSVPYDRKIISPSDLLPVINRYSKKRKEHFYVVTLNGSNKVVKVNLVSIGILNKTLVHPREVFKPAILDDAKSVILVHNHPSGEVDPSDQDKQVTERLVDVGELLGIDVLDHIIISKKDYYSFAERNEQSLKNNKYPTKDNLSIA